MFDVSLLTGWFAPTVQAIAMLITAVAVCRFGQRRWLWWITAAGCAGVASAAGAYWVLNRHGYAMESAPIMLWVWVVDAVAAAIMAVVGWRVGRWWQRVASSCAFPAAVICVALVANQWTGYYSSLVVAWDSLTDRPLDHQVSLTELMRLRNTAQPIGRIVQIEAPTAISRYNHRTEYVYLPPIWFAGKIAPQLPALIMVGGVVNKPLDWMRMGNAVRIVEQFAADHHGFAPILVFADPTGNLHNDTECVDSARGNVDTHITTEIRDHVTSRFSVTRDASQWGIVGWSMGGTCAALLAVRHPDRFSVFESIGGDLGPNVGDKNETIAQLFGGDARKWESYDTTTVIKAYGSYRQMAAWIAAEGQWCIECHAFDTSQGQAATSLADTARAANIDVVLRIQSARHVWAYASQAFAEALPWIMDRFATTMQAR